MVCGSLSGTAGWGEDHTAEIPGSVERSAFILTGVLSSPRAVLRNLRHYRTFNRATSVSAISKDEYGEYECTHGVFARANVVPAHSLHSFDNWALFSI